MDVCFCVKINCPDQLNMDIFQTIWSTNAFTTYLNCISGDDEEEDEKAGEGACGGTSTDLAAMSSDEDEDKCPICLNSFNSQPVATPENCEHYFCLDCILEWAKVGPNKKKNYCPS